MVVEESDVLSDDLLEVVEEAVEVTPWVGQQFAARGPPCGPLDRAGWHHRVVASKAHQEWAVHAVSSPYRADPGGGL